MTHHSLPKSGILLLEHDADDGGWKSPRGHLSAVLKAGKILEEFYLDIYTEITQVPKMEVEEEGRMTRKQGLNVSESVQVSEVPSTELLSPAYPIPKMTSLHLHKGRLVLRSLLTHNGLRM